MTEPEFDRLFREEYPKLVALGMSVAQDRDVARELAQETMLRAHTRWATVATYDQPGAWLRRVMSNLLIDHHRARGSERAAIQRITTRAEQSPAPLSEWAALVAPLSPSQRVVATLYYAEDRSVAEIASALDLSTGTVKSTLSKIRRRLRDHVEKEGLA